LKGETNGKSHRKHQDEQGHDPLRVVGRGRAEDHREFHHARQQELLRRHHLPPRHQGLHDSGRRPDGHGQRRRFGWGGRFNDEIKRLEPLYQGAYKAGTVAMANAGPNTNGSQFFIMHADYALPPSYTKFGRVIEGQEVVDAIAETPTGAQDRPRTDVVMEKVTIEAQQ